MLEKFRLTKNKRDNVSQGRGCSCLYLLLLHVDFFMELVTCNRERSPEHTDVIRFFCNAEIKGGI